MEHVVLINGKKRSNLSVFNRISLFGDGLFETCLVENKKVRFWSKHFDRLEKGRAKLSINTVKESLWLKEINKAISSIKADKCVVKIILSRGEGSRGYGFKEDIEPTRIVIASTFPESIPDQYSLTICHSGYSANSSLSGIKHCNRLEQVMSRIGMKSDECIMLDNQGFVISASQANIFTIKDGVLSTPILEHCGIEGTRRKVVIRIAEELGINVNVKEISVKEILDSDEIFITNSVIGVRPVCMVNDQVFKVHETTKRIMGAFMAVQNKSKVAPAKSKFEMGYKKWITLLIILVSSFWLFIANNVHTEKHVVYEISPGSTINSVADELKEYKYINSGWYFVLLAKLLNLDDTLKSGYYDIKPDMSLNKLLVNFSNSKVATRKITLIEGLTLQKYYHQLSTNDSLRSVNDFDKTMKLVGISKPYEGKFWPDTYVVNYGDTVSSVLTRANKIMQEKLENVWRNRQKELALKSIDEMLILASLVEKETANHKEKSQIAGVFLRRLKKGMRLQTDASIVYALGNKYTGKLTKKDLKIDSPYNTYKNHGLPPGAIGSVGAESLYAASHPDNSQSLYFVSKKDGTHAFADTYKGHQKNINKYLNNL